MPTDPPAKRCLHCSYILDGLPENRCPECGRPFDPHDPRTYQLGHRRPFLQRWANPPPLWNLLIVALLTGATLTDMSRQIDASPIMCCLAPLLVAVLAGDYALRVAALITYRSREMPHGNAIPSRRPRRWIVPAVCVLLVVSAEVTRWPLRARFHFSRPAFEQATRNIQNGTQSNLGAQRIGLYHVQAVEVWPDGRICFVTGDTIGDPAGFEYNPANPPGNRMFPQLAPRWYAAVW